MNKSDKLIVALLVALLGALMWYSAHRQSEYRKALEEYRKAHPEYEEALLSQATNAAPEQVSAPAASAPAEIASAPAEIASAPAEIASAAAEIASAAAEKPVEAEPARPERTLAVSNAVMDLVFTSRGGALASATLRDYRSTVDPGSGPVELDFSAAPALSLEGIDGFGAMSDFSLSETGGIVRLSARSGSGWLLERTVACTNGYHLAVTDSFRYEGEGAAPALPPFRMSTGPIAPEIPPGGGMRSIGPTEGIDVRASDARGRAKTLEQNNSSPLVKKKSRSFAQMFGTSGGGCSAPVVQPSAPVSATDDFSPGDVSLDWVAVRDRFFVQILRPSAPAESVRTSVRRKKSDSPEAAPLEIEALSASLGWPEAAPAADGTVVRSYAFYVGPRKMDELRHAGPDCLDIMRFGTWSWFCRRLLDLLNFIHRFVPNYGWSIVVLTLLVRLALLPLSRKSQQGMKKMSELQPKMAAINEKYKDDPQKRQAETMRLYAENHVNPLSSCLPMLIQLPIFIALFTVLRSSVELRFASWLWVSDLSSPEGLFREWFPFGGLNVLPLAMAATMMFQSLLSPSAGDPKQQRMMAVMMPVMMLYFFYSMPAALCLYWSVSQALAIIGLWWARRAGAKQAGGSFVQKDGSVVVPPRR